MNDIINQVAQTADAALDVPPIMVPEKFVAAVFDPFKRKLASARRAAAKVDSYDIMTTAGMNTAKELRASFRDIRTALENERKARKAPIIAAGKLLDSRAAELTAEIEPLERKYDDEIKGEERRKEEEKQKKLAIERERVEAIEKRIDHIRNAPARLASAESLALRKEIEHWTVLRLDPADYQEYLEQALTAVNTTLDQLAVLLDQAESREAEARRVAAERAELERLRAEQAAIDQRLREEAAERARVAQVEREAAAKREADMMAQMEDMRRQMVAMQAATQPPAAPAAPAEDDPVLVPVELDGTGIIVGAALVSSGPASDGEQANPVVAPLLRPQAEIVRELPTTSTVVKPADIEILAALASWFGESRSTVAHWIMDMDQGVLLDQAAGRAQ